MQATTQRGRHRTSGYNAAVQNRSVTRANVSGNGAGGRITTLLDLLVGLLSELDCSEETLVKAAADSMNSGRVVLSGTYRGVPACRFA